MAIRYPQERAKASHIRNLTSLTVKEFEALVPAFEAQLQEWTLEGKRC